MANDIFLIGANDEHGLNPPTPGKRTPVLPGLNRQIYESEFNRATKNYFIEALLRNNFSVFDVKPEIRDISISERVRRVNSQNLTLLVTFAYNAYGENFNSVSGVEVFYSPLNASANDSRLLAQNIYNQLIQGTEQTGRGVKTVEAGFMTNLREARLMINPLFQIEVAEETCAGVCNYLGVPFIPRFALSNYPILRTGSQNNFVYLLQFILNRLGANLTIDGDFGSRTQNATKDFQASNGITADGIVGPTTWKYLLTLSPYPTQRQGYRGNYVRLLQQLLESNLAPVGNVDGIFGNQTASAVRNFQRNNNLSVDGIVGPATWNALTGSL